jgi:flagellar protein FlgJ
MDITGIYNNEIRNFMTETHRHDAAVNSFQAVLDKAMQDRDAVEEKALKDACESFEAYFLQLMFREMRKSSFDDSKSFIPKSNAEKIFIDMLDEEVSKSAAKGGGIGLADMMYKQLSRQLNPYASAKDI